MCCVVVCDKSVTSLSFHLRYPLRLAIVDRMYSHNSIEHQAHLAVENQPRGSITSLAATVKSRRRLTWKGTKRPSIHQVSSIDQDIQGIPATKDASVSGDTAL